MKRHAIRGGRDAALIQIEWYAFTLIYQVIVQAFFLTKKRQAKNQNNKQMGVLDNVAQGAATGGTTGLALGGWGAPIGAVVGGAIGLVGGILQHQQQSELTQQQLQNNETLANYQQNLQYNMWQTTGPTGMVEQYKEAGLNPALVYAGGAGNGGTTGAGITTTVERAQPVDYVGRILQGAQSVADTEKTAVEVPAIQTGTAKTAAEIPKTNAETANIATNTQLLAQETDNKEIEATGLLLQNQYDEVRNKIQAATSGDVEATVSETLNNLVTTGQKLQVEINAQTIANTTARKSQAAIIEANNQNVKLIMAEIIAKQSAGKLSAAEAGVVATKIEQAWQQQQIEKTGQQVSVENTNKMAETILKSAGIQAASQLITTATNALVKKPTPVINHNTYVNP